MANNLSASIQVLAGGAGPGASTDVRLYRSPLTIRYVGTTGDRIRLDMSGENAGWVTGTERILSAIDEGEVCFTLNESVNYLRFEVLSGNAGATASASVTGEPLTTAKPTAALTVNNSATPGPWADCRAIGGPRTILYEGTGANDTTYLEGSDDGASNPYQVYPTTGSIGRTGQTWAAVVDKIPNYMRIVRPTGTTAGARCAVIGPETNVSPGASVLLGGQPGPVAMGSSDGTRVQLLQNGNVVIEDDGTTTTVGLGTGARVLQLRAGSGGATLSAAGGGNAAVSAAAAGNVDLTPGSLGDVRCLPRGAGAGDGGRVSFYELAANGSNAVTLRAPDAMATSTVYELPAAAPTLNGQRLGSTTGGVLSWSAAGGVYLRAQNTSGQSIPDADVVTIVTGWTTILDTASAFNPTTGVYTVPIAGQYVVTAQVEFTAIAANLNAGFKVGVYVNGVVTYVGTEYVPVAAANYQRQAQINTPPLLLAAGDLVTIRAFQNSGSAGNVLSSVANRNFLGIYAV